MNFHFNLIWIETMANIFLQMQIEVCAIYILFIVFWVHSGGVHGGHYYAYIRPTLSDQWFKFDDERVMKEEVKRALEEQYGGEEELPQPNPGLINSPGFINTPFKFTKYSNAYMLVYIRESDKDKIICNVDEKDIAEHLRVRLKKEHEEMDVDREDYLEECLLQNPDIMIISFRVWIKGD